MKRFTNICLVHECDPPTLERAAALAKDNRARLTVMSVVHDVPCDGKRLVVGKKTLDLRKLVLDELQADLKETAKLVRSLGVRPATRLVVGDQSLEIIRDLIERAGQVVRHGQYVTGEAGRGVGAGVRDVLLQAAPHVLCLCLGVEHLLPGRFEIGARGEEGEAFVHRQRGIVRALFHRLSVRLLRCRVCRSPSGPIRLRRRDKNRCHDHAHVACQHFGQTDEGATFAVCWGRAFARAFLLCAFAKIAVEREFVVGDVEMAVNDDG